MICATLGCGQFATHGAYCVRCISDRLRERDLAVPTWKHFEEHFQKMFGERVPGEDDDLGEEDDTIQKMD